MRRRRQAAGILAVLVLLLGIPGGCYWSWLADADAILDRGEREWAEAIARVRAADDARPALFAPEEPGNAWEIYTSALNAFKALPGSDRDKSPTHRGPPAPPDLAEFEPVFERCKPILEELRRALRRPRVNPDLRYEEDLEMSLPLLGPALGAAKFFSDGIALRRQQGRWKEALELSVLLAGLGADLEHKGPTIASLLRVVVEDTTFRRLRESLESHSFDAGDLEWAGTALERLESGRRDILEEFRVDAAVHALPGLVKIGRGRVAPGSLGNRGLYPAQLPWKGRARYGFSNPIMAASALSDWKVFMRELEADRASSLRVRRNTAIAVVDRLVARGNPLTAAILPDIVRSFEFRLGSVTRNRLARISLALARHHAERGSYPVTLAEMAPRYLPAEPLDPMTDAPFRYSAAPDRATVYSLGGDGDDDGGRPAAEERIAEDGDIVWTVKRQ